MSEEKLLARCHADGHALRELLGRSRRLYSFILHLVGPFDADDLFEDVWLRTLNASAMKKPEQPLRLAVRVCREQLKKADRTQENTGTYEALFHTDEARRLGRGVANLPKGPRLVLLLRECGGLGFKEIAVELRLPLGQTLADMSAALAALHAKPVETPHKDQCLLYESGELSEQEDADFEKHLPSCPGCRAGVAAAQQAHAWLGSIALDPPEALVARILEQGPAPGMRAPQWKYVAFAAVFLAVSAFVLIVGRHFSDDAVQNRQRLDCSDLASIRQFKLAAGDEGDIWARCVCGGDADRVQVSGTSDKALIPPHGDQMVLIEWFENNLPVDKAQAAKLSACVLPTYGWSQ